MSAILSQPLLVNMLSTTTMKSTNAWFIISSKLPDIFGMQPSEAVLNMASEVCMPIISGSLDVGWCRWIQDKYFLWRRCIRGCRLPRRQPLFVQESMHQLINCSHFIMQIGTFGNTDHRRLDFTQWGWDKMVILLPMTFLYAASWMNIDLFRLKFHWNLFLRVQLTH